MSELNETSPEPRPASHRRRHHKLWRGLFAAGLLAAGVAIATPRALAWASHGHAGFHGRHGAGFLADPEQAREHAAFAAEWLVRSLDGTPEQQARAQAIAGSLLSELAPLAQSHHARREDLVFELSKDSVDREALERWRAEQVALFDEASKRVIVALGDLSEMLTPEQRAELIEHARKHRALHAD